MISDEVDIILPSYDVSFHEFAPLFEYLLLVDTGGALETSESPRYGIFFFVKAELHT